MIYTHVVVAESTKFHDGIAPVSASDSSRLAHARANELEADEPVCVQCNMKHQTYRVMRIPTI